jgi:hypothetical protein
MYRFPDAFATEASTSSTAPRMPWRVPSRLSLIEQRVALLSRHDPLPPGPIAAKLAPLTRALFGVRAVNLLADPRLEALRQFAIAVRMSDGNPSAEAREAFYAAGFAASHVDPIHRLCRETDRCRRERAPRLRRLTIGALMWAALLPPIAIALTDYFGDGLMGVLGATMAMLILSPAAAAALAVTPHKEA